MVTLSSPSLSEARRVGNSARISWTQTRDFLFFHLDTYGRVGVDYYLSKTVSDKTKEVTSTLINDVSLNDVSEGVFFKVRVEDFNFREDFRGILDTGNLKEVEVKMEDPSFKEVQLKILIFGRGVSLLLKEVEKNILLSTAFWIKSVVARTQNKEPGTEIKKDLNSEPVNCKR